MRNTFLLFIFLLSSIAAFGQPGTTITYEDQFGQVTLNYLDVINGKRRYRGNDGTANLDAYWTGTRWDLLYGVGDILYFSTANTALNPPHFSIGNWTTPMMGEPPLLNFSGTGTESVLPVELMRFEGNNKGKNNLLSWKTASESNNMGFDIERSTDGIRFGKIGFVKGNGTTTIAQSYTFEDSTPSEGIAYYRLKQLNFGGRFEYSKIISITQIVKNEVAVFPNPSNGIFTITGLKDTEGKTFVLMNSVGQTTSIKVQNNGQVDMSAYPSGVYYLHIGSTSSKQIIKLLKE